MNESIQHLNDRSPIPKSESISNHETSPPLKKEENNSTNVLIINSSELKNAEVIGHAKHSIKSNDFGITKTRIKIKLFI